MLFLINNISIRGKLFALTLLPLIGFISFAGYYSMQAYQEKVMLEKMLVLTDSAAVSSLLVHELQKERGASAGYLSSKGEKFQQTIKQHRQTTDQKNRDLQAFITSASLTPQLTTLFNKVNQQLDKLPSLRQQIDNLSISVSDEVAFYSNLNALLLSIINNTANENENSKLAISAVTVGSFLQHKERAGIERAVLSNVFSIDHFTPVLLQKFISLLAEQAVYLDKFKAHATTEQLAIYQNNLTEQALKNVKDYENLALDNFEKGAFNTDPKVWFDTITQKINLLKTVEVALLENLREHNQLLVDDKEAYLFSLLIIILISFVLILLLSFYITSQLNKGIHEITSKLISITTDNDLTLRIDVNSKDELGEIGLTINKLVKHLQGLVNKIQHTSTALKSNLAENIKSNHIIEGNINSGTEQVTQVVTATTEMSSTVNDIARNAIHASSETEKANTQSQDGNREVEETIQNISNLSIELRNASTVIDNLNGSVINIGKFLSVINEVSEKTNLLALNAAIEAARAGDYGRGFSVVADEVRSLAFQTKESTNEIEMMITELQSSSKDAQKAMSNGIEMVNKSVDDAKQAGQDILLITHSIQEISQMNEQIATAAEQQSSVTEEINRNMLHIQDGYTEMQLSYGNIDKCSEMVDSLATELEKTVNQFKI
ncbi:methyl-accepting chemotaxis protein [Psychromonas sp. SR45-3]|uniref:methyl-accepting chemotaxis protein n=1 Tax=Psychromonas sp. SR45-3 TaxID=2760930 RepID=UPI0015F8A7A8|nr:methyl-accepting chemotaxis protein [Psychromonas sp. SR45-3]MBB1271458.1 methyl-accepting chemotaxis protein [Psychromonas sp. SR45-3]